MAETEYPASERLGADMALEPVSQPASYGEPKEGPGRWVILYANGGADQLGYIWCGDNGALGFVPSSDKGVTRVPAFYTAFSKAAAQKTPAGEVFAYYAEQGGLGLTAGQIEYGSLDTLPS